MAKQKRRGYREGSIYQRKDGRWVAEITLEGGKRKTFYGKTRREVQERLLVALNEQKQGTLALGPQQTVKQFLEYWLEDVHKPTIRPGTYRVYRTILDKHLLPSLGHLQIQKLTPQHIQSFYARLLKEGCSPNRVRAIHQVLHRAFEHAVRVNLVGRNICDLVELPQPVRREMQALSKEQAQQLLAAAHGHRLEVLLTVAVATGMRSGELRSLRWKDIDFPTRSLHVRRSVSRIVGYGYVEGEPKTARSKRKIILPQFVIDALKQHRVQQLAAKLKAGAAWQDLDLVFCNYYGRFIDTSTLREQFIDLLDDAGLPHMRFHDLRHSAATILLSMGVHPKVVQELLGHSNITMTLNTYSHVLPSMQKDAMDKLDQWFGQA